MQRESKLPLGNCPGEVVVFSGPVVHLSGKGLFTFVETCKPDPDTGKLIVRKGLSVHEVKDSSQDNGVSAKGSP